MKLPIVLFGDPVLRSRSQPVTAITPEIRALARDMLDTMYANEGIGLAAEQVGRKESMCVIDLRAARPRAGRPPEPEPELPMPLVLINPRILAFEGEQDGPEGCLSFPDVFVAVHRSLTIRVSFMNLDGQTQEAAVSGLLARAMQHEIDHLNGVLLVDHMSMAQKVAVAGKLKRLKKQAAA